MEDNIDRIRIELEEARQSLQQTIAEFHQKVETVSTQLEPRHLVERHLPLAACIAGAVGFAAGNRGGKPALTALILAGLLGTMLREGFIDGFRKRHSTWRT
jgi:hypothetical protein